MPETTKTRQTTTTINGRDIPITVCSYCGADMNARIYEVEAGTRNYGDHEAVSYHTNETWHGSAKCVEGDEPSYKMGGPA